MRNSALFQVPASVDSTSSRIRSTASHGARTRGDRLVEVVAADLVDHVEHGAVAGEDVPLEQPHHGRRVQSDRGDLALGERADVEAVGDRGARLGHRLGDRGHGRRVVGEPAVRPVGGDRGRVGVRIARESQPELGVQLGELPEAGLQLEDERAGTPGSAVLGPDPDALEVRVRGDEALQRVPVLHAEVVREGAEVLELAPALELDDAALVAGLEGVVERQVAVEVAEGVLRRDDEASSRCRRAPRGTTRRSCACRRPRRRRRSRCGRSPRGRPARPGR